MLQLTNIQTLKLFPQPKKKKNYMIPHMKYFYIIKWTKWNNKQAKLCQFTSFTCIMLAEFAAHSLPKPSSRHCQYAEPA